MTLQHKIDQQRLHHIVIAFDLAGEGEELADDLPASEPLPRRIAQGPTFMGVLDHLTDRYPQALVELALVETIVDFWAILPLPRGVAFLEPLQERLVRWETGPIDTRLTPEFFQQITQLDPDLVFGVLADRIGAIGSNRKPINRPTTNGGRAHGTSAGDSTQQQSPFQNQIQG